MFQPLIFRGVHHHIFRKGHPPDAPDDWLSANIPSLKLTEKASENRPFDPKRKIVSQPRRAVSFRAGKYIWFHKYVGFFQPGTCDIRIWPRVVFGSVYDCNTLAPTVEEPMPAWLPTNEPSRMVETVWQPACGLSHWMLEILLGKADSFSH